MLCAVEVFAAIAHAHSGLITVFAMAGHRSVNRRYARAHHLPPPHPAPNRKREDPTAGCGALSLSLTTLNLGCLTCTAALSSNWCRTTLHTHTHRTHTA